MVIVQGGTDDDPISADSYRNAETVECCGGTRSDLGQGFESNDVEQTLLVCSSGAFCCERIACR